MLLAGSERPLNVQAAETILRRVEREYKEALAQYALMRLLEADPDRRKTEAERKHILAAVQTERVEEFARDIKKT